MMIAELTDLEPLRGRIDVGKILVGPLLSLSLTMRSVTRRRPWAIYVSKSMR